MRKTPRLSDMECLSLKDNACCVFLNFLKMIIDIIVVTDELHLSPNVSRIVRYDAAKRSMNGRGKGKGQWSYHE